MTAPQRPPAVLHIVPDDALGGGAVIVARLIEAFADAAGRTPPRPGVPGAHLALLPSNAEDRLRALFAPLPHRLAGFEGRGSLLSMARAIAAEARPGDLVHAHGTRAAAAAALARRALGARFRLAYTVHGFHGLAQPGPLGLRVRLERALARAVDATAFVSAADAALARKAGLRHRGPAEVIENGLPGPERDTDGPQDAPRDVDLLFVGRLVYQKNPQAFVETCAALEPLLPAPPRIRMVGAGELAEEVDALASGAALTDFKRHDGLPHGDTLALMSRARFLVMTSRWEGLPTVAIEAALRGAPAAGFSIPPLAEALGDLPAAQLLTAAEPEALAHRLAGLLADEPHRRELAEALRARAQDRYSPARMAARYADLYAAASA